MVDGIRRYLAIGLALPICVLIFLANLALPLGVAIWLAYPVVVAGAAWLSPSRFIYLLAAFSTLLIGAGYFLAPAGIAPWIAGANRVIGVLLVWGSAYLVSNRSRLLASVMQQAERLAAANEQLALMAEEIAAANENLQVQADELQGANGVLQNQAEELEVQAEELQAQNEELATLADSLEKRVLESTGELRRANEALQRMSARLVAVQENERRAISLELHDESSQLLTTLAIRLGLLRSLWERGESPDKAIDELKQIADQLADGLHRLAVNLRPASLDSAGLVPAVQQYIETYSRTYSVQVDLLCDLDGNRLAPDLESSLYRIVQEALTNVARHAHASHVSVVLGQREGAITCMVEDDGVGFDVEAATRTGRLGLSGMQERAELRGGRLSIESRPGSGTTVFVEVPCLPRHQSLAVAERSPTD